MNPAQKALWFIESHLGGELTLDEIAGVAGISRFHMVRAFAAATGLPVMRYVRARRLTEAARALAGGAPDILTLALDADYGSHGAFTRAFRDHFGVTPETVRRSTRLDNLRLQEPIVMDSTLTDNLQPPRLETGKALLVAGLGERYTWESGGPAIPGQWQRFHQTVENIPAGSERSLTASAATATIPAISTTSPVSKCLTSPTCRAISAASGSPTEIRGLHPQRPRLDHPPHHQHDLESMVAGFGDESRRCAQLRALWREFDPLTGNGGLKSGCR